MQIRVPSWFLATLQYRTRSIHHGCEIRSSIRLRQAGLPPCAVQIAIVKRSKASVNRYGHYPRVDQLGSALIQILEVGLLGLKTIRASISALLNRAPWELFYRLP